METVWILCFFLMFLQLIFLLLLFLLLLFMLSLLLFPSMILLFVLLLQIFFFFHITFVHLFLLVIMMVYRSQSCAAVLFCWQSCCCCCWRAGFFYRWPSYLQAQQSHLLLSVTTIICQRFHVEWPVSPPCPGRCWGYSPRVQSHQPISLVSRPPRCRMRRDTQRGHLHHTLQGRCTHSPWSFVFFCILADARRFL